MPDGGSVSEYRFDREVRFAVVMYGGVSLAVYINGVAQELLRMVRATAPDPTIDGKLRFQDLRGSESVYRALATESGVVTTRFVVDILSGTSAGGINAIFLAKALANGQSITGLRDLWVDVADIADLFNEPSAYKGLRPRYTNPPESLLASERLYHEAHEALGKLGDKAEPFVDQVDLAVTTTDVRGLPLPVQLTGKSVDERRHRTVMKFRYSSPKATGGPEVDEFEKGFDPLLAFAARATSAFPFAFTPVQLEDLRTALEKEDADAALVKAETLFPDHTRVASDHLSKYSFADGGYLDNKPFSYATETLRRRRADIPVVRKLVYVEPDPKHGPAGDTPPKGRPDVAENVAAALFGIPRYEPIRDDIEAVIARNQAVQRIRDVTSDVTASTAVPPAVGPYWELRRLQVLDDLTSMVGRVGNLSPGSDELDRVQGALKDVQLTQERLRLVDVRWWMRRFALLNDHLDDLHEQAKERGPKDRALRLLKAKRAVNDLANVVRQEGLSVLAGDVQAQRVRQLAHSALPASELKALAQTLVDGLAEGASATLETMDDQVEDALAGYDEDGGLAAFWRATPAMDAQIFPLTYPDLGETNAVDVHRISPEDADALKPDEKATRLAGVSFGHFGAFLDKGWRRGDLLWGQLDAAQRLVDVVEPVAERAETHRIKAQAAILRDELDVPETPALAAMFDRPGLDELRASQSSDEALLPAFSRCYRGPAPLDAGHGVRLLGHGADVTGKVLRSVADKNRVPSKPAFWLSRAGRFVWGYAELAFPSGPLASRVPRHWGQLLLLGAIAMFLVGVVFGIDGARGAGGALAGGVAVALLVRWLLEAANEKHKLLAAAAVAGVAVVALAAVEVGRHGRADVDALRKWADRELAESEVWGVAVGWLLAAGLVLVMIVVAWPGARRLLARPWKWVKSSDFGTWLADLWKSVKSKRSKRREADAALDRDGAEDRQ